MDEVGRYSDDEAHAEPKDTNKSCKSLSPGCELNDNCLGDKGEEEKFAMAECADESVGEKASAEINKSHDSSAGEFNITEDVDPFEDTIAPIEKSEISKSAISPIHWDSVSDEESETRDELHVDAPGDEFSREEEDQNDSRKKTTHKGDQKEGISSSCFRQLFKHTKYFMIKSNNYENIEIAKVQNVWATTKGNEARLNKAFFSHSNVLLIFSVRESGKFQGFARIVSSSDPRIIVDWVMPSRMNTNLLSNPFRIKWISKCVVLFHFISFLGRIYLSRGQVIC